MKLLIVSHTPHCRQNESLVGWGSTVREIDHLATLFDEIVHLAPVHSDAPPASSLAYTAPNVRVRPVRPAGGRSLFAKLGVLSQSPAWMAAIRQEMCSADVIHIRCPANISLIALLLLFVSRQPRPRWVKYAGNWRPSDHDRVSYRFHRWLLRRRHHGAVVTVNGSWPHQPDHIVAFHNPCLTQEECEEGREAAARKVLVPPFRMVYVGALIPGKGADMAIRVLSRLTEENPEFALEIVGDGPLRATLHRLVDELGLESAVRFHGSLPRGEVPKVLLRAHILLHPSRSEGFPKVVAEGMAYGAVPIAGAVSGIPQLLAETNAGIAVETGDERGFVEAILRFVRREGLWSQAVESGLAAARWFTYDAYLDSVIELFESRFDVSLRPVRSPGVLTS